MDARRFSLERFRLCFVLLMLTALPARAASTIVIVNQDAPNVGLNDPSPIVPAGGNTATTVGAARLQAVQFAASLWAQGLKSDVTIRIAVQFQSLGGTSNAAVLGIATPESVYRDFAGAPLAGTWYPSALADKLAGLDLSAGTATAEAQATFNGDVGNGVVLAGSHFYYGFDGHPSPGDISFLEVATHELAHGLGFVTYLDETSGAKLFGYDDAFELHLELDGATPSDFPSMTDSQRLAAFTGGAALHWTGPDTAAVAGSLLTSGVTPDGRIEMYAPTPYVHRSSIMHVNTSMTPHQIMEPFYTQNPSMDFRLLLAMMGDMGWGSPPGCTSTTTQ